VLLGNGAKEYRPFRWQDFSAINGSVDICLPGEVEGACSHTAVPGDTWRYGWSDSSGGYCYLTRGGVTMYQHATACEVSLFWSDQPNIRVNFPGSDVARTFARGHIDFLPRTFNGVTGFHLNVVVTLEEYMYGLAEMPVSWHLEALKAQVVTARTFAAYKARLPIRNDCSCNLVWDTTDQSYRGWHSLNEGNETYGQNWVDAVDQTAGEVVVYPAGSGALAETYYSSSTGGATENVWEVWGPGTPGYAAQYSYLASKDDPWSELYASPPTENTTIRWRHVRTAGEIVNALVMDSAGKLPGQAGYDSATAVIPGFTALHSIEILEHNTSGSPRLIEVTGVANGEVTTKQFVSRGPTAGQSTIGTLRSRLSLRGHYIYSFDFPPPPAERWFGSDRYATAAAVSQHTHPDGAAVVYLTVGTNHPDAIAAGPAAAAEGAPVLLVSPTTLPSATAGELTRLAPTTVVIVGGEAAVGAGVESQVATLLPEATTVRRAGPNRYATAVALSQAAFPGGATTVFVATGEDFPDAVVAAPAAILSEGPLLLVPRNGALPTVVRSEIIRLAPERIVVVGGTGAVSDTAFTELTGIAATVERIAGSDRYAVAAAVSAEFFAPGSSVYVAVGTAYPDALTAGGASAQTAGPVLLVQTNDIPGVIEAELIRLGPNRIVILGGTAVVSAAVETALATFAN
jgi:putative cell wall-binding protein/peptidoglycan hydrolase-like amidase